jgi:ubiquinone/menaquinone biosynthesis C-methylase UbiE
MPKMDKWTSGPAYETWMGRWSQLLADDFLDWLSAPPGARWLDVCCGTGILSQTIVQRCSPASVQGVDAAPTQIAFAREHRAQAELSFDVADAMALPFEDCSFDVAVSGLGLNFIPDPIRALGEMKRVTHPGGTIAAYVCDYQEGARFVREFWDAALELDPEALSFDQGRRFAFCTPEGLRKLFEAASLDQITVRALEIETCFSSFDDYWEPFLKGQGSAPHYLATRDEPVQAAIRERLRASLAADANGAITLPARAWAVRAQ